MLLKQEASHRRMIQQNTSTYKQVVHTDGWMQLNDGDAVCDCPNFFLNFLKENFKLSTDDGERTTLAPKTLNKAKAVKQGPLLLLLPRMHCICILHA